MTDTDDKTGIVTGNLTATDLDSDTLTYTAATPKKGALVIGADGKFTYTPTAAPGRRLGTQRRGGRQGRNDLRHRGRRIRRNPQVHHDGADRPNPIVNHTPTNGHGTVTSSSSAIGTVTGKVSADDVEETRSPTR